MRKKRANPLYKIANDEKYVAYLFLIPAVIILFSVSIFPLIYSLRTSLTNFTFGMPKIKFVGFKNFASAFKDDYFWNGLKLTAIFVAGSTLTSLVIGLGIALLVDKIFKRRELIRTIVLIPMIVPSIVVGIIWLLLFMPDFSVINYFIGLFRIKPPQWLLIPGWALVSIMIAYIWQWTPFFVLMITAESSFSHPWLDMPLHDSK